MHYFLGIEANYTPTSEIHLTQTKYIKHLLSKVGMANVKGMPTPMITSLKLSAQDDSNLEDPTVYRSIVGGLPYATITSLILLFQLIKCVNICIGLLNLIGRQ